MSATTRLPGSVSVVPTTFTESGELDLESQKRCVDFMIDAGSDGLCILANFSEQFLLADDALRTLAVAVAGAGARERGGRLGLTGEGGSAWS